VSQHTSTTSIIPAGAEVGCDPAARVTRSLLGYGVIAGPLYVSASLAQAFTRPGFDLTRHPWSLLSNGSLGWLQITNFIVTGAMIIAFAIGLRRALGEGPGHRWAPLLMGGYGLGLVAAGLLRADPAAGFPVGTPAGATTMTWHGIGHFVAGAIGFSCLIGACFVLGRRFARSAEDGARHWAVAARVTGVVFLAAFIGIASGAGNPVTTLGFVGAVMVAFGFISALAMRLYRTTTR
jgi:Protein of unknown function (DUF998)